MDYSERVQRRYIDLTKPMIPFHFLLQRCVSIRLLMSSCCLDLFGTYQYQYEKLLWESVTQYVSVCVCLCVWHYSTRMRWHTYIHTNIYFNIYPSISYHLMALSSSFCSSLVVVSTLFLAVSARALFPLVWVVYSLGSMNRADHPSNRILVLNTEHTPLFMNCGNEDYPDWCDIAYETVLPNTNVKSCSICTTVLAVLAIIS